jgi:hypothetical protein
MKEKEVLHTFVFILYMNILFYISQIVRFFVCFLRIFVVSVLGVAKSQRAVRRSEWLPLPQVLPNSTDFIAENLILHGMQRVSPDSGNYECFQAINSLTNKSLSSESSVSSLASLSSPNSKRACHRSSEDINDKEYNAHNVYAFNDYSSRFNDMSYKSSMSSENGKNNRNFFIDKFAPITEIVEKSNSLDILASIALQQVV